MRQSNASRRRRKRSSSSSEAETLQKPELLGTPLQPDNRLGRVLLRTVDTGFAALILLLPFLMGGREGPGQLALVLLACLIAAAWALFQCTQQTSRWTLSLAEPLLLAAIALLALQMTHLPADTLQQISPRLPELLPLWGDATGGLPAWNTVSLAPAETRDSLMTLIAYVLIFVVAVQRLRSTHDIYRLMTCLAAASIAMAVFGLVQYATSNGRFFWVYDHPYTDTHGVVKGAFTNRNHFASFLALGVGPLVWCLIAAVRQSESTSRQRASSVATGLAVVAIAVVVFAALLSLSRGGAVALGVAGLTCGVVLCRSSVVSAKVAVSAVATVLLVCGLLFVYGEEQIQRRLDQLVSTDIDRLDHRDARRAIWTANVEALREYPVAGTGAGTHRDVYPLYMEDSAADHRREFTHAENGYLQVGLETGLSGLSLVLCGFLLAILWSLKGLWGGGGSPLISAAQGAALSGFLVSLAHSATDFVWYVPACMVVVILLAASACRTRQLLKEAQGRNPWHLPAPALCWMAAGAGVLVLSVWMVPVKQRRMVAQTHWHNYLRISLREDDESGSADSAAEAADLRDKLTALAHAAAADPTIPRVHVRLSRLYLKAFQTLQDRSENPMSLAMIRNAALSGGFPSEQARRDWMDRVFQSRRVYLDRAISHSQQSIQLCPLRGHAYLFLSELSFLESNNAAVNAAFVSQSMLARPHDPRVLFIAGRERLLNGEPGAAIALWQKAFRLSRSYQRAITRQIAQVAPAAEFIRTFGPDAEALAGLCDRYRELGRTADLETSLLAFAEASFRMSEDPSTPRGRSIRYLLAARRACDEVGDSDRARGCFERALALDPYEFRSHYGYGVWLADRGDYTGAAEHFKRCTQLRPGDDRVRKLAIAMRRRSLTPDAPNPLQLTGGSSQQ